MTDDTRIAIAIVLAIGLVVIRILEACLADKETRGKEN